MHEPGEQRAEAEREDGIAGEALHDEGEEAGLPQRLRGGDDEGEGQDHQPEADADAPDLLPERRLGEERRADAEDQQHRHEGRRLEGQGLHDEGRADVGAEHHAEGRHQGDEAALGEGDDEKAGCRRALQGRRHAEAGAAGGQPAGGGLADRFPQPGAEGAHDRAADHLGRPDEQRDTAEEVQKKRMPSHPALP